MISSRHWLRTKIYSQFFGVSQRHILSIIMLFVNLRFCLGGKTELFGSFFSLFYNFFTIYFPFHSYASLFLFSFHSRIFRPNFATFFLFITEIIFFFFLLSLIFTLLHEMRFFFTSSLRETEKPTFLFLSFLEFTEILRETQFFFFSLSLNFLGAQLEEFRPRKK